MTFPRVTLVVAAMLVMAMAPAAVAAPGVRHPALVSQNPADDTPRVLDGRVLSLTRVGNEMIVGGDFTRVATNAGTVSRSNLFAFDMRTGLLSAGFHPAADAPVAALASAGDGRSVFVGGYFTHIDGAAAGHLAKLDVASGARTTRFHANVRGDRVSDLDREGQTLYLAGQFYGVDAVSRDSLAAVDTVTGRPDPRVSFRFSGVNAGGTTKIERFDVSPDGREMIAVGNFTRVDGLLRRQIVRFRLGGSHASVSSWSTARFGDVCVNVFDSYMRDIDISADGRYFVVGTTGGYGLGPAYGGLCDTVSRWAMRSTGPKQQPTWVDYTGGDTTLSVLSTGAAIYAGGHMRWENNPFEGEAAGPGAVPREGVAALDPRSGLPLEWNPGRDPRGEGVFALYATEAGLWMGTDTCCIAGEQRDRLHFLPLAGGTRVVVPSVYRLPNQLWDVGDDGLLRHRHYDGIRFSAASKLSTPGIDWREARGAFVTDGRLYTGWSDGRLYERTFGGGTLGAPAAIDLHGLTAKRFPVSRLTGMFLRGGRLYYTVTHDRHLYFRYFTPDSDVVGALTFVADGALRDHWGSASGMFLAGRRLYVGHTSGRLDRIRFQHGRPIVGSATPVSGPGIDGQRWNQRGLFLFG